MGFAFAMMDCRSGPPASPGGREGKPGGRMDCGGRPTPGGGREGGGPLGPEDVAAFALVKIIACAGGGPGGGVGIKFLEGSFGGGFGNLLAPTAFPP